MVLTDSALKFILIAKNTKTGHKDVRSGHGMRRNKDKSMNQEKKKIRTRWGEGVIFFRCCLKANGATVSINCGRFFMFN